jgi:hypothetical protein
MKKERFISKAELRLRHEASSSHQGCSIQAIEAFLLSNRVELLEGTKLKSSPYDPLPKWLGNCIVAAQVWKALRPALLIR